MRHFYLILFCVLNLTLTQAQEVADDPMWLEKYQTALDFISSYQFEPALVILDSCHQADSQNKDYLLRMGYCCTQLGRFFDAKSHYTAVLKLDFKNIAALSALGSIYERENNFREALLYYRQFAIVDSTNSFAFKRCGSNALRLGQTIDAISNFLKARELNPRDMEVIEQLSSIALAAGQLDDAEKLLDEGLEIDGNNIRLLQTQARLWTKRKEYRLAADAIEKTLYQGDTSDYYQMLLAISYCQLDSINKAIYHLEHLVNRKKDTEQTHEYLGFAYRKKGDLPQSQFHYETAIKMGISEKIDVYYANLGETLEKQGKHREAIAQYEKAYSYNPKPEYLFFLGYNSDSAFKDKRVALKYYKQYLASKHKEYASYTQNRADELKTIIK